MTMKLIELFSVLVLFALRSDAQESQLNVNGFKLGFLLDPKISREFEVQKMFRYGVLQFLKSSKSVDIREDAIHVDMGNGFDAANSMCTLISSGVVGVIGMHTSNTVDVVSSISNTFNVPYLTTSMPTNTSIKNGGYQIYFKPPYLEAVFDLVRHYGWKRATYFYSTYEGQERMQQFIDMLMQSNPRFTLNSKRVESPEDAVDVIKGNIRAHENVLLDLPAAHSETFLNSLHQVEAALLADAAYVTSFVLEDMSNKIPNLAAERLSCTSEPTVPWTLGFYIVDAFKKVNTPGLFTGNISFDQFGRRKNYELYIIESHRSNGQRKEIGTWSLKAGVTTYQQRKNALIEKDRIEISNKTRIVTSILIEPFFMLKKGDNLTGNDRYEGYCVDLTKLIAGLVGFDFVFKLVEDRKFGSKDENGRWDGMIGELLRREADLAVAPITVTSERENVVHFSKPFMSVTTSVLAKRFYVDYLNIFQFYKVFSYEVWGSIVLALLGASVMLWLVSKVASYKNFDDGRKTDAENFTLCNSIWYLLGCSMMCSVNLVPKTLSGRIASAVWWLFVLLILSSYISVLFSFFNVQRGRKFLTSSDLSNQTSTVPVYERMWSFMKSTEPSVFVRSSQEGVARVRRENGKYAFITESTTIQYVNQQPPCDTMQLEGNFGKKSYGVAMPVGSDLRERITLAVLELAEAQSLAKLERLWWHDKGKCSSSPPPGRREIFPKKIKMQNIKFAVVILMAGIVVALFITFFHLVYKACLKAKQNKTKFSDEICVTVRSFYTGKMDAQSANLRPPSNAPLEMK
ncbi:hypothetical protein HELRODRAFT_189261 [Helobdella robusta]|uniref:Glutamate receptor n=1 Tax=Helobdella robusta TaxID=6412 RepID=T1FQV9_HELRO|nr:hypothetical protein HELRODRAFT_189261 [Helobdella robusta]ESN96470.1 hypothetical protein HELRODRAFT_189261 [Helobdella robusta]